MKRTRIALVGFGAVGQMFASAVIHKATAQPADMDLPALIECRADPRAWGDLAFSIMGDPQATTDLGWNQRESANPYLQEYDLSGVVQVFGHETRRIALTSSGPMAVLDGVKAEELAASLGVTGVAAAPGQFLGEKVVSEATDEDDGMKIRTRVSINVSTVESHPGQTLAGCSYAIEMLDG